MKVDDLEYSFSGVQISVLIDFGRVISSCSRVADAPKSGKDGIVVGKGLASHMRLPDKPQAPPYVHRHVMSVEECSKYLTAVHDASPVCQCKLHDSLSIARHCQAFDIIRAFCASVLVQVAYMGLTSLSGDAMKKHLTGFFKRGQCDATCTVVCYY